MHYEEKTVKPKMIFEYPRSKMNFHKITCKIIFKINRTYQSQNTENEIAFIIASEESFLLSHMTDPKNAIKSLILVVEQFCIEHFLILFQF